MSRQVIKCINCPFGNIILCVVEKLTGNKYSKVLYKNKYKKRLKSDFKTSAEKTQFYQTIILELNNKHFLHLSNLIGQETSPY